MADAITSQLAHLYRRAGFGATPEQLAAAAPGGFTAAVDALLDQSGPDAADAVPTPSPFLTNRDGQPETVEERKARQVVRQQQRRDIIGWWLERMTVSDRPLREKLTFFWHAHFATSLDKVNEAAFMLLQNQTIRSLGAGTFETLAQAVAQDPAMMIWLDANQNKKGSPNENFARELMELFTIGIGSYTDADVREAARAFTGWRIDKQTGTFSQQPRNFDAGVKTLLGQTGAFTGEQVVTLLTKNPASARFVASKLWSRFAYPVLPDDGIVSDLAPGFAADGDITKLMRALLNHPQFVSVKARQGLVKQPVEYVVGALRALGLRPSGLEIIGPNLPQALKNLNQVPFEPPSVGGWPQNGYWVSTATELARLRLATQLVAKADASWLTDAADRPSALAARLGVDGWTGATTSALTKASAPKNQLIIALVSPEYVLN